jgi:inner membrane protein
MDNLTHSLVGLAAAKAGLERLSPGAAAVCVLAANAPDCDVAILLFGDRWTYLQNHRGITHSIVGVVFLAFFLPLIFYGVDRLVARLRNQAPKTKLRGLILASVIATATHPLLDWTNSYGIRFFLPWSSKWYYGDIVYIIDPYLWLILGGACFLLAAKTLSGKIVWAVLAVVLTVLILGVRTSRNFSNTEFLSVVWIGGIVVFIALFALGAGRRFGNKIAIAAFALVLFYWTFLGYAHSRALANGYANATREVAPGEQIIRLSVMPTLASPLNWDCVFETDRATYRFGVRLMSDGYPNSRTIRYEKPSGTLADAMQQISQERPARIFLGFARYPVAQLADPDCTTETLVQLADLRYTEPGSSRGTFTLQLPVDCPTNDQGSR